MLSDDLKIYKLLTDEDTYVSELGWVTDEFCVWVSTFGFYEFIKNLECIVGNSMYEDGGIEAHIGDGYVVFGIGSILEMAGIDVESMFPKEDYKH